MLFFTAICQYAGHGTERKKKLLNGNYGSAVTMCTYFCEMCGVMYSIVCSDISMLVSILWLMSSGFHNFDSWQFATSWAQALGLSGVEGGEIDLRQSWIEKRNVNADVLHVHGLIIAYCCINSTVLFLDINCNYTTTIILIITGSNQ